MAKISDTKARGRNSQEVPGHPPGRVGETPYRPLQSFRIERIEHKIAKAFIVANHYSHNCPTGLNVFFGAFLDDGTLYAVADYGMGANMDKGASLARLTGLPVRTLNVSQEWLDKPHKNMNITGLTAGPLNCYEIKRLCRLGTKEEGSQIAMTRFLSLCHKTLKREGIKYIVSYSDPMHNKFTEQKEDATHTSGGIYKAANFKHLGETAPGVHVADRLTGEIIHRRVAFRYKNRWNAKHPDEPPMTIAGARDILGLVPYNVPGKERWFLAL